MKHIFYACLLISCSVLWTEHASAQSNKSLSPLPAGGFQFAGTWSCTGTFRNNQVHKSTYTGAVILDGKWLELAEQDTQPATGYVAKYLIGYDPQKKDLVEFDANNFGAAVYSSNEGWQKGVLTMSSPISHDAKAPYIADRFLYSITGKASFTVDWQISRTTSGGWSPADHLSCERSSKG